ncbi:MAG: 50S ribosomal protein L5 [Nanoarchaeota archaeon]|nr:50S ribosomal protein L5 [Nanoarchaeota archaeon]MCG2718471.1 50S ribosomal protein L5 [Nanoarchaeota archaeon]
MRTIKIEKVTLNIGTGEPGDKLEKAKKLLGTISGMKAVPTASNKRIPTWKVRPGLQIGCRVTIRGEKAKELLKRLLQGVENTLPEVKFDRQGNFSFGVPEYLDVPELKYDAEIGVIGFNVAVTLKRAGFRIKHRKLKKKKIPVKNKITKEESIEFVKKEFGTQIGEQNDDQ